MVEISSNLTKYSGSDLGENVFHFYDQVGKHSNSTFVDLGVRGGISSSIFLINSKDKNNKVFGVDVDEKAGKQLFGHSNYTKLLGDSVTIGKGWSEPISGLFVDTFHIKEQVMCELYYWFEHIVEGGFVAFHDTNWPDGKHDKYGGIIWPRVEEALKDFFGVSELNYEDEFIKMSNYPKSWGMTIVEIKKKRDYKKDYSEWSEIFDRRNHLISLFYNENNISNINIDLKINV